MQGCWYGHVWLAIDLPKWLVSAVLADSPRGSVEYMPMFCCQYQTACFDSQFGFTMVAKYSMSGFQRCAQILIWTRNEQNTGILV
jgi:hypothetical protein